MRMNMADWRPLPVPGLLWLNTGVLVVLSSVALQWAQRGRAPRTTSSGVQTGLLRRRAPSRLHSSSGRSLAWQQLDAAGYFVATNPANTFFYLLTAAARAAPRRRRLVALGRTTAKVWRGARDRRSCA